MLLRAFAALAAAAALAGCGGDDSATTAKPPAPLTGAPNTPKGAVQGFIAGVKEADWDAACARVSPTGLAALAVAVQVSPTDATDCAPTLEAHGSQVRALVGGAAPGEVTTAGPDSAVVSSPKGDWPVSAANATKRWQIAGVPHGR